MFFLSYKCIYVMGSLPVRIYLLAFVIILSSYAVQGWSCTQPTNRIFSRQGSNALLQFDVGNDLPSSGSRTFSIKFYDGTSKGSIVYIQGKVYTNPGQGVDIHGDAVGNVVITLNNVQRTDAGTYLITAVGIQVRCIGLYILGVPTKTTVTVNKTPEVGESATITCSSTSTTTPSNHSLSLIYNWKVDNVDNPVDYTYSTNKKTLTIINVTKSDNGKMFLCSAKEDVINGFTSVISDSNSLYVLYGPEAANVSVQSPYIITEGDTALNITCSADCLPGCTYNWRNLTDVRSTPISLSNVLSLKTVNRYMTGHYKCISSNAAQQYTRSSERTIYILVKHAPDVEIRFSTTHFTEGAVDLTLFCDGIGVPAVFNYVDLTHDWNDMIIPNSNTALSGTPQYSSIRFSPLRFQDTGTYTCTLNNGIRNTLGILNQSGSRQIMVEVRPKIMTTDLIFSGATSGQAKIQVPVYSFPRLETFTITRYDGEKVVQDDKYNLTTYSGDVRTSFYSVPVTLPGFIITLTIHNLEEEDFGNYTLMLENRIGTSSSKVFVVAQSSPYAPQLFKYKFGSSIPTFIWQKNYNGGLDQSFVIQISPASLEQWTNHTNINANDQRYKINNTFYMANITGLEPGIYKARIFAKNSMGDSYIVMLGNNFIVARGEGTKIDKRDSDNSAFIIGMIVLGIVCAVLAVYSTYATILLRRKKIRKGTQSDVTSTKQSTYVNLACRSVDKGNQRHDDIQDNTGVSTFVENESVQQYTDLSAYCKDNNATYESIKQT